MEFSNAVIGSRLMETITEGLYDGNLNCLREYVQNSIDSNAKNIEIYFENGNKDLVIKDDGLGMSKEKLIESLSIGISNKNEENAGWRGIGIWSGVPTCKRIVIVTKSNTNNKLRVEIDNDKLRNQYWTNKPLLNILSDAIGEIEEIESNKDNSFEGTMVRLESILDTQMNIFKEEDIFEYLKCTIPAPFDKEQFSFAAEVDKWLREKNVRFPQVNVLFQGKKIFRPPFKSDIFFNKVVKKEFKVNDELIAVGWFLTSKENKILKKPDGGVYFKKKGFTLGDENLAIKQFHGTYNQWQYGEIHIVHKNLRENAARNNFEYNNIDVNNFLYKVRDFIGELQGQNYYQSDRNISKDIKKAQKLVDKGKLGAAKKELDKINEHLTRTTSFPTEPSLQDMKTLIDSKSERDKKVLIELEAKIKTMKPDNIERKREQLETVIDNLPIPVKNSIKRMSSKGLLHPEISVTDIIKEILEKETGLKFDKNEIFQLSQAAYGWKDVIHGNDFPLLTIDKENLARNRRFGVMVYTVHDMFVNLCKHEKNKDSYKWFENVTEEEKYELVAEMYSLIGFIYKLIEKSEKYQHKPES